MSTNQPTFAAASQAYEAGRAAEANAILRNILANRPDHLDALHLLGTLSFERGRFDESADLYAKALRLAPAAADLHGNLGLALSRLGRTPEAIESYRKALALNPQSPETHNNLGNALTDMQRTAEAIESYRRAVQLRPNYAEAHFNLGRALYIDERIDDAIVEYRLSQQLNPRLFDTPYQLSLALRSKMQWDDSLAAAREALALNPRHADSLNNLGNALKNTGRLDEALNAYDLAVKIDPDYAQVAGNRIYAIHFHPRYNAEMILREQLKWNERFIQPLRGARKPHETDRDPDRRLRIGYVSGDFKDHVVGRNLLPLFRLRDRGQFEVFCYSNEKRPDAMTEKLRGFSDGWREIAGVDDSDVAAKIRQDKIDILMDLSLHMGGGRLKMFGLKPAPLQGTFAGYPAGTGVETIDFRLTDPFLDPDENNSHYVEKSIRLPQTFWCYDGLAEDLPVGPLPAIRNGYITFGCLNNFCKGTEPTLRLWRRVMEAVPDSRLLLLAPAGSARKNVLATGFDPRRIEFADYEPRRTYLRTYGRIDISLETIPYNGHTTSLDSMWMGVPVLTLVGKTSVARAGWSQLSNLGLTELAAQEENQYVRLTAELADDLPRLTELRGHLRDRIRASPLMDAAGFARNIEAAYRSVWQDWCRSFTFANPRLK